VSQTLTPSMRRSVLIAALRDPTTWPPGFAWNFWKCSQCAIGLYCQSFEHRTTNWATEEMQRIAQTLGMTQEAADHVFGYAYDVGPELVTPAMVADHLEAIHRELEAAGK
jgi:hypothetical protein